MRAEPETQALLERLAAQTTPRLWELSPPEWRAATDLVFAELGLPPADLVDTEQRSVPGPHGAIPVRIYRPRDGAGGRRPALVYLHGGGMVTSSIDTYDALVQRLSAKSGCVVVSVDYRLAPEFKFPVPLDDAYTAAVWVTDSAAELGLDRDRIAIGGDSAGGLLAAATTLLARDRGRSVFAFQLLIYPAVGTRGYSHSMAEFAAGYVFERDELDWAYTQYLNDWSLTRDPLVCPIAATDFGGLPPAYVLCAELEIMRDDIAHYAELLTRAGVPTEFRCWPGTIHPFLNFAGVLSAGRAAIDECADRLRHALASKPEPARPTLGI